MRWCQSSSGLDEILMTPPHITDSDLVHMMDLVWTSHTDKQQPHRQHLSWKRNAVACFGCCFTADLTSTYMFRAIFDCYGNTLDLRVACGKQAMCCRNHIAKMALPFWLKLGYLYLEKFEPALHSLWLW